MLVMPADSTSQVASLLSWMQLFSQKAGSRAEPADAKADVLQFVKSVQPEQVAIRKCASDELSEGHSIRGQQFTTCIERTLGQLEMGVQEQ